MSDELRAAIAMVEAGEIVVVPYASLEEADAAERRRLGAESAADWRAFFAPCEAIRPRDPGAL